MTWLVIGSALASGGERADSAAELAEAGFRRRRPRGCWRAGSGAARQARRYVNAAAGGRVQAPQATVVFTVKLPGRLAAAVREHARASRRSISTVVAQALEEFLALGPRNHSGK